MKISVSQKHIDQGKCKIAQKCMIAAAIRDADPTVSYVSVRTNGITITKRKCDGGDGVRQHWQVPTRAARAIIKFDGGEFVAPFSFEPKLVDEKIIPAVKPEKALKDATKNRKRRAARVANGLPQEDVYGRRTRIAGV